MPTAVSAHWLGQDPVTMPATQPTPEPEALVLPPATREFILKALGEASVALQQTNGLRATRHILVEEGVKLTQDNSFRIDNVNHLLLMNLIRRMLAAPRQDGDRAADAR
jgi:hypothetical protein